MQANNLLKMNDWEISKFVNVVFAIQIAVLGVLGLEMVNVHIPILRELITSIYLLFIPGVLILRVLKIHNTSNIETIVYSVGLSIASLMFIGFFMNILLPLFGISKPISLFYLIVTIILFTMILSILSYMMDNGYSNQNNISISLLPPKMGFIYLIPFLAILGTYSVNFYHDNVILMVMIFLIALTVILVAFDKIPQKQYPVVIFVISISLLLHTSLISQYLWGWDVYHEYYLANLVVTNSIWDLTISDNTNAMLSIVMLAPILSKVTNIDLIWVFKIIYPFIFSLVPIGLYLTFKRQMNCKIAFLAVFFFMSIFTFFTEMNQLARQEIAELFLVLVLLLITDNSISTIKRALLSIIFAVSIIVSHYGLSYIFMLSLVGMYLFLIIDNKLIKNKIFKAKNIMENKVSLSFVLLFAVFTMFWYLYISSSFAFITILDIINHIGGSITTDFLDPYAAQGAAVLNAKVDYPILNIPKDINLLLQFFILSGITGTIYKLKKTKFKPEFISFSLISLLILFLSIILPFFASALNITRIYHISLFFLAPFAIIGGIQFFKILFRIFKKPWTKKWTDISLKILAVLLVIQLLFYTGFVFEIAHENPESYAFCGMVSFALSNMDYPVTTTQEVDSMKWLYSVKNNGRIYADEYRRLFAAGYGIPTSGFNGINNSYIFLGKFNLNTKTILISKLVKATLDQHYIDYSNIIRDRNSIYDNGNAEVFV